MAQVLENPTIDAAASGANPSLTTISLYVGDLDHDVNDPQLYDLFNQVAQVVSVRICRDVATQQSLGYGYVNFSNAHDGLFLLLNRICSCIHRINRICVCIVIGLIAFVLALVGLIAFVLPLIGLIAFILALLGLIASVLALIGLNGFYACIDMIITRIYSCIDRISSFCS